MQHQDYTRIYRDAQEVAIRSRDYWFKIVEFLQQNWALVDSDDQETIIWFIADGSGVFDKITVPSAEDAYRALRRNGFRRFAEDERAQSFLEAPEPPFARWPHPNGPIYSSGRFWS